MKKKERVLLSQCKTCLSVLVKDTKGANQRQGCIAELNSLKSNTCGQCVKKLKPIEIKI